MRPSAIAAARKLLLRGPGLAVVKLGAKGLAYAAKDQSSGFIPPFSVQAVDTVAAGDCFCGALSVALDEGMNTPEALRFASAAGALATTKHGAAAAAPTRAELESFLANS